MCWLKLPAPPVHVPQLCCLCALNHCAFDRTPHVTPAIQRLPLPQQLVMVRLQLLKADNQQVLLVQGQIGSVDISGVWLPLTSTFTAGYNRF